MVPWLSLGTFIEVLLGEQVAEGVIVFWYHPCKGLLGLISISLGCKVVGMVYGMEDKFLLHLYGKNGVAVFKFFVPAVVWVRVGEFERVFDTLAASKNDTAGFPVNTWIVTF